MSARAVSRAEAAASPRVSWSCGDRRGSLPDAGPSSSSSSCQRPERTPDCSWQLIPRPERPSRRGSAGPGLGRRRVTSPLSLTAAAAAEALAPRLVPRSRLSSLLTSDALPVSLWRASNAGCNRFRREPRRSSASPSEESRAAAGRLDSDAVEPRQPFNASSPPRELTDAGSTARLGDTEPRTGGLSLGRDADGLRASPACHGPTTSRKRRASAP